MQIEEGTGAQLKLNTFYKPEKYPELLILKQKRVSLRKNQINKLLEMYAEPLSKPMENIHQMIMGFGKTKVLLPILAFKKPMDIISQRWCSRSVTR